MEFIRNEDRYLQRCFRFQVYRNSSTSIFNYLHTDDLGIAIIGTLFVDVLGIMRHAFVTHISIVFFFFLRICQCKCALIRAGFQTFLFTSI